MLRIGAFRGPLEGPVDASKGAAVAKLWGLMEALNNRLRKRILYALRVGNSDKAIKKVKGTSGDCFYQALAVIL